MLSENAYEQLVAPEIADYVSPLFERLCQQTVPRLLDRRFSDIAQWWFKQHELDVVGLSEDGLVAGECKFTSQPVREGVLSDLERTTTEVRWSDEPTGTEPLYVLLSRSGYTEDLKREAKARPDVRLYGLPDVLSVL